MPWPCLNPTLPGSMVEVHGMAMHGLSDDGILSQHGGIHSASPDEFQ